MDKIIKIKHEFPSAQNFIKLFNSVGWTRSKKRIEENRKYTSFAVSVFDNENIIAMGRVVGDGAYFTIYDVVVDKNYQNKGIGTIIMKEIIYWYKEIEDDDTFLYVNASLNKEKFYERFGFQARPNNEVGSGMKYYGDAYL